MTFWADLFRRPQPITVFEPNVTHLGSDLAGMSGVVDEYGVLMPRDMSPVELWNTQPHLRTVVSFVARNIAQLGLHTFERVSETDRRRSRDNVAARALANVDGTMTTFDLMFALAGDLLLYDRAYWWVARSSDFPSGWMIRRIPPNWVTPVMGDAFTVKSYLVRIGNKTATLPASTILPFTNYAPGHPGSGSSTVEALKQTLQEQIEASRYRAQVWKRGGRVSAVLERPKDAPDWSDDARERFREDWYAKYTGRGNHAGGTPILEDGMTLRRVDFNAQEQQFVEAAKLSLSTVASGFHVNPTMVGQLDNANFSNVREFRKMLYGDSLGPYLAQFEQRINTFLLPMLGMDNTRFYAEFNIAEKLQGNFDEQTSALQSSVGRPWMTADEARSLLNLPSLGGDADQLVTPLNVLVGGQSSPNDSGSQNRNSGPVQIKAAADPWHTKLESVLKSFFKRQESAVRSRMGAKAPQWWDEKRWNDELSAKLYKLAMAVSGEIGPGTAKSLGFEPGDFDTDQTMPFLKLVAEHRAENINGATRVQLEDALKADEPSDAVDSVWNVAQGQRSGSASQAIVTFVAAFAVHEAAEQMLGSRGRKTWVTGANPRPSHAAMSGQTVKVGELFSNGMKWPGDSGDADQVAGCNCSITVTASGEDR